MSDDDFFELAEIHGPEWFLSEICNLPLLMKRYGVCSSYVKIVEAFLNSNLEDNFVTSVTSEDTNVLREALWEIIDTNSISDSKASEVLSKFRASLDHSAIKISMNYSDYSYGNFKKPNLFKKIFNDLSINQFKIDPIKINCCMKDVGFKIRDVNLISNLISILGKDRFLFMCFSDDLLMVFNKLAILCDENSLSFNRSMYLLSQLRLAIGGNHLFFYENREEFQFSTNELENNNDVDDETDDIGQYYESLSIKEIRDLANSGNLDAQNLMGDCFKEGLRGLSKSPRDAFMWYQRAAYRGHAGAQYNLGNMYYAGMGVVKSDLKAYEWFKKAFNNGFEGSRAILTEIETTLGVSTSCIHVGSSYSKSIDMSSLTVELIPICHDSKSIEDKQMELAVKDDAESVDSNFEIELDNVPSQIVSGAEMGDPDYQNELGDRYYWGDGVEQSYAESAKWYRKAAEQGNRDAQYNLGDLYLNGKGVDRSIKDASFWFTKSADMGCPSAIVALKELDLKYDSDTVDFTFNEEDEETEFVEDFEEQDDTFSIEEIDENNPVLLNEVGDRYYWGLSVVQSYGSALIYYKKAASFGYSEAEYNIGRMYRDGVGVTQSYDAAKSWFEKANLHGDVGASTAIDEINSILQSDEKICIFRSKVVNEPKKEFNRDVNSSNFDLSYDSCNEYCDNFVEPTVEDFPEDKEESPSELFKSANQGDPCSQNAVGDMYYFGEDGFEQSYDEAFDWYGKSANQGNSDAQYSLGLMFWMGKGVERSLEDAEYWFRLSAAQGDSSAAADLKKVLDEISDLEECEYEIEQSDSDCSLTEFEQNDEDDPAKCDDYIVSSCEDISDDESDCLKDVDLCSDEDLYKKYLLSAKQGNVESKFKLGQMYETGTGVVASIGSAILYYRECAEENYPDAFSRLYSIHSDKSSPFYSEKRSSKWLLKAAETGDKKALIDCAKLVIEEKSSIISEKHLFELLSDVDNESDPDIAYLLGSMYELGIGTSISFSKAFDCYKISAEQGNSDAQFSLSKMYESGTGCEKSDDLAWQWCTESAKNDNHVAQCHLGYLYENGIGVIESQENSIYWYTLSAENGNPEAQLRLGVRYEEGSGVEQSNESALYWYEKSYKCGNESAKWYLDNLIDNEKSSCAFNIEKINSSNPIPPVCFVEDDEYEDEDEILTDTVKSSTSLNVHFALFYVDSRLVFCVPYTDSDKHYLDEMLEKRTVPKSKRIFGVWKKVSDPGEYIRYYADYSNAQPNLPREKLSYNWNLKEVADCIDQNGSLISLEGKYVDLFDTDYSKITGITEDNLGDLISLGFSDWLDRENIPWEDNVRKVMTYDHKTKGNVLQLYGDFRIGYKPEFSDAIDFLHELDIDFVPQQRSHHTVSGLIAYNLKRMIPYDFSKSLTENESDIYPIYKIIPSRVTLSTKYYNLEQSSKFEIDNFTSDMLDNERIIDIFNAEVHPECGFEIIDSQLKTVRLISYDGSESEYSIPFCTLFEGQSDTYHVTEISDYAFHGNDDLISVEVPSMIQRISRGAFEDCINLRSVELSKGLLEIEDDAFSGCINLHELTIPSTVVKIGSNSLSSVRNLELWCSSNAISSESISNSCNLVYKKSTNSDDNQSFTQNLGMSDFINSLDSVELEYVKALCLDSDLMNIINKSGKTQFVLELKINEKAVDTIGEEIFEDEGLLYEDYAQELMDLFESL